MGQRGLGEESESGETTGCEKAIDRDQRAVDQEQ
jgi:hypothetical protein